MRFARPLVLVALSLLLAAPVRAAEDAPPELPFPRARGGVGLGVGFASFHGDGGGLRGYGPTAQIPFRVGARLTPLVSVYFQGAPFVMWHSTLEGDTSPETRTTIASGGVQNAILVAFTLADRVDLAVGPAFDLAILTTATGDDHERDPVAGPGGHLRASVRVYRTYADRRPQDLVVGADFHMIHLVVGETDLTPLWSATAGVGWEWN
jgi:hypothetical protein